MGRSVVSLDVGSSGIRALQVSTGKTVKVEKVGYVPLDEGVVAAGTVQQGDRLTAALRDLWNSAKFQTKNVMISFGGTDLVVRTILDVDWLADDDMRSALPYLAATHLPGDADDFVLDYHVIGEDDVPDPRTGTTRRTRRIVLTAVPSSVVEPHVAALTGAGLTPVSADLRAFTLIRACLPPSPASGAREAIVDIGADLTTIVVHHDGQPQFVRTITAGGREITTALRRAFLWDDVEAERAKAEIGLAPTAPAPLDLTDSVFGEPEGGNPAPDSAATLTSDHPAQGVIAQASANLISEIRTSIEYFLSTLENSDRLDRVLLSGGGSLLAHLPDRLSSELRTPVEYASALRNPPLHVAARLPDGLEEPQWTVAVGTALGVAL